MPQPLSIAIIIPAYNEALTIAEVIRRFSAALPEAELVIVDNRSSDNTGELAKATLAECGAKGRVLFELRPGKGNAVRRAFHDVVADVYVMIDADMTYHPEDLPAMLAPVLNGEADLRAANRLSGRAERTLFVYESLRKVAQRSQAPILRWLKANAWSSGGWAASSSPSLTRVVPTLASAGPSPVGSPTRR